MGLNPFKDSTNIRGFAAQYYKILYWFFRDRGEEGPSEADLLSIKTTLTKLLQEGVSIGIISPIGDNTDISIAKQMEIRYDKGEKRLIISLQNPWRDQVYEILQKYGENNGDR